MFNTVQKLQKRFFDTITYVSRKADPSDPHHARDELSMIPIEEADLDILESAKTQLERKGELYCDGLLPVAKTEVYAEKNTAKLLIATSLGCAAFATASAVFQENAWSITAGLTSIVSGALSIPIARDAKNLEKEIPTLIAMTDIYKKTIGQKIEDRIKDLRGGNNHNGMHPA